MGRGCSLVSVKSVDRKSRIFEDASSHFIRFPFNEVISVRCREGWHGASKVPIFFTTARERCTTVVRVRKKVVAVEVYCMFFGAAKDSSHSKSYKSLSDLPTGVEKSLENFPGRIVFFSIIFRNIVFAISMSGIARSLVVGGVVCVVVVVVVVVVKDAFQGLRILEPKLEVHRHARLAIASGSSRY